MARKPTRPKAKKTRAKRKAEPTDKNQSKPWLFKPGQSGNPAGRPVGSRNKLCGRFIDDLALIWNMAAGVIPEQLENLTKGQLALLMIANSKPTAFVKAVSVLTPREFDLGDKTQDAFRDFLSSARRAAPVNPYRDDNDAE